MVILVLCLYGRRFLLDIDVTRDMENPGRSVETSSRHTKYREGLPARKPDSGGTIAQ